MCTRVRRQGVCLAGQNRPKCATTACASPEKVAQQGGTSNTDFFSGLQKCFKQVVSMGYRGTRAPHLNSSWP